GFAFRPDHRPPARPLTSTRTGARPMPAAPHFTPRLFKFLRELKRNNERPWFQANKTRYVADVQEPMLRFIADFATPLAKISKHFDADPRPSGGSMFRIYRDTRFAKERAPYKT